MNRQFLYLVIMVWAVGCGDPPSNTPSPKQKPIITPVPDAAYQGVLTLDNNEVRSSYLTLFRVTDNYQGTLFVRLGDEPSREYAVYPVTANQTESNILSFGFDAPTCSSSTSFCRQYNTLPSFKGTLNRSQLSIVPDEVASPVTSIDLNIDPDLYREPDDGIRPSGCEPEPCEEPWPLPLKKQSETPAIYGVWTGSVFLSPQYHQPFGAPCSIEVARKDNQPVIQMLECLDVETPALMSNAVVSQHDSKSAVLYSHYKSRLWRWTGKFNTQLVRNNAHRMYRFYGHVSISSEPVDKTQSPSTVRSWQDAGTFAFTSWGE